MPKNGFCFVDTDTDALPGLSIQLHECRLSSLIAMHESLSKRVATLKLSTGTEGKNDEEEAGEGRAGVAMEGSVEEKVAKLEVANQRMKEEVASLSDMLLPSSGGGSKMPMYASWFTRR